MKKRVLTILAVLLVPGVVAIAIFVSLRNQTTVEALAHPWTRAKTYHGLWSEVETAKKISYSDAFLDFNAFRRAHKEMRFFEIPIPDQPDRPMYMTLSERLYHARSLPMTPQPKPWGSWDEAKQFDSWKNWILSPEGRVNTPRVVPLSPEPIGKRYVVSMHESDGRLLDGRDPRMFRGNNVAEEEEVFYDINQDGWVERVCMVNFAMKNGEPRGRTLRVYRVDKETPVIFYVLVNVGDRESLNREPEWGFKCRDVDGDGRFEIQIGPQSPGTSFVPATTFFWNAEAKTFESPDGPAGPHYLVVPPVDPWDHMKKLFDAGKLQYPLDGTAREE